MRLNKGELLGFSPKIRWLLIGISELVCILMTILVLTTSPLVSFGHLYCRDEFWGLAKRMCKVWQPSS